jgi:hypothetical protein
MTFSPKLNILPASQRALWKELKAAPKHFVLYGGTGLALRLGHRFTATCEGAMSKADLKPVTLKEIGPKLCNFVALSCISSVGMRSIAKPEVEE